MATTSRARFPVISGENLAGESYTLPTDFEAPLNLLLVAFQREQQSDVDTWLSLVADLEAERPDVRFYELPVLSRLYRPFKWVIDGGMRSGIPDTDTRRRTITLYTDKATFLRALDLSTEESIYALLVDRDGTVHWRSRGRLTERAAKDLREFLDDRR